MRNSSSLDWLRFMHTPNDYRVSPCCEYTDTENKNARKTKKYLLLISFLPFYFIPFHCSKSDAKVSRKRDAKQSLSIGKNKTTKMRYIDMYNTYI